MRWPWIWRACLLALLFGVPETGHAQIESREGIALQNQLYQLRQEIQSLRGDIGRGNNAGGGGYGPAGGGDIAAQLLGRVQAMEEQARQLRGLLDELRNQEMRHHAELSKRLDDMNFQASSPGRGAGALPPVREVLPGAPPEQRRTAEPQRLALPVPGVVPPPSRPFTFDQAQQPARPQNPAPVPPAAQGNVRPVPPEVRPAPAAVEPAPGGKRTPELALQEGQAALARRDYASAERSAREVMANRTSPRAYDGQFLLAEALAGEKQFPQAAIAFDDAYNRSKKGRHAQDALLGLAGALTAINEKRAACDTLGRLRVEFPQLRADLLEQAGKTGERAGCAR